MGRRETVGKVWEEMVKKTWEAGRGTVRKVCVWGGGGEGEGDSGKTDSGGTDERGLLAP